MPTYCETKNGSISHRTWNQNFTTVQRAKDKKTRMRIAEIANACCDKGLVYTKGGRHQLRYYFEKIGSYAGRLKAAQKGKIKGKGIDCSGFCNACCSAAGASMSGSNSAQITNGHFSKYKKLSYANQLRAGTLQRGDVVARNGHAAIIAKDMGNVPKDTFKNVKTDGSKKIVDKKYNEIVSKYLKKNKWKSKLKKKKSLKTLNKYLSDLQAAKRTIQKKIDKYEKKKQTDAVKAFLRKLRKRRGQLTTAIGKCKSKIQNLKKKQSDNNKTSNSPGSDENYITTTTTSTTTEASTTTTTTTEDPESTEDPETYNLQWIYAGPNRFITKNEITYKDYVGDTFCDRATTINSFIVTNEGYWDIEFDMPFQTLYQKSGNLQVIKKDNNNWRFIPDNSNDIQKSGKYVFTLKTGANTLFTFTIILVVEDD